MSQSLGARLAALLAAVVVVLGLPAGSAGATSSYDPIGTLPEQEGSGVVASRQYPGVYWAHLDSGSATRNVLYAFKLVDGRMVELSPGVLVRTVTVPNLSNRDWEDIAVDDAGHLWLGDIGNNSCTRDDLAVHQIREPDPYTATSATVVASYPFTWPDPASGCTGRNSEALLVLDGVPYLVSKTSTPALYRFPSLSTSGNVVHKLGELTQPDGGFQTLTTAADLSSDRRRLVVTTAAYHGWVYETATTGLTGDALLLDLVSRPPRWQQAYRADASNEQVEGAAFAGVTHDLVLVSEGGRILYFPAWFYEGASAPDSTTTAGSRLVFGASGSATSGSWQTFALPLSGPASVALTLDWDDPGADLNLFLKDPAGTTVAWSREAAKPETLTYAAATAGTWTAAVKIASGASAFTVTAVLGVAETAPGPSPSPSPAASARPTGRLVPESGALLGLWAKPRDGSYSRASQEARWRELEAAAGRTFDVAQSYYPWETPFPTWREPWHIAAGRIPLISWNGTFTSEIASGAHDALIRERADAVKALGAPVFLRWFWEMDGRKKADWAQSPTDYIAAWRHIHAIFAERGATNAVWVWCPNASAFASGEAPQWYPGDAYVDWVCGDGYNWAPGRAGDDWRPLAQIFRAFHAWGMAQGKPMMIGETGVQERDPGEKPAWFAQALAQLQTDLPGVAAVVYFDSDNPYPWWLDSSPESLAAFAAVARDPYLDPRAAAPAPAPTPTPEVTPEPAPTPTPAPEPAPAPPLTDPVVDPDAEHVFRSAGSAASGSWHVFEFPVAVAGPVTALLDWDDPTADLNLFVKDPTGTTVAWANGSGKPEQLSLDAQPGTYTVAVKIAVGAATFAASVDTPDLAFAFQGQVSKRQVHRFDVTRPRRLSFTLAWDAPKTKLSVALLDPSGRTVLTLDGRARPKTATVDLPVAGKWRLVVTARKGTATYALTGRWVS
jgi:uncharacterized protein YfaP (DUF2135 family)